MKFWWVVACCLLASQQAWAASTELLPYEKFCFNESLDGYTRNTEFTFRFHLEKSRGLEQLGVTVKAPSASEGEYLYETTASAGDFAARLKDDGPHTFCFENVNSRKHVVFWSHHEDVRTWRLAHHPCSMSTVVGPSQGVLNNPPEKLKVQKDKHMAFFRFSLDWWNEELAQQLSRSDARAIIRFQRVDGTTSTSKSAPFEVQWYPSETTTHGRHSFKKWAWDYRELQWANKPVSPKVISRQRTSQNNPTVDVRFTAQFREVLRAYMDKDAENHDQITVAIQTASDETLEFYGPGHENYALHPQLIIETDNSPFENELAKFHRGVFGLQSSLKHSSHEERYMRDTTETTFTNALWFKLAFFFATLVVYIAKMVYTKGLFKQA